MPIVAETERLTLRTWEDSDREAYARYCNQTRVMKWLGGVQGLKELDEDVDWFIECQQLFGHTLWVVERKGDGAFLGFVGLDRLLIENGEVSASMHDQVEVGWRLRSDVWGLGYATEAARVSLDIAFRVRRVSFVVARIHPKNDPSVRIAKKLGLEPSLEFGATRSLKVYRIDRKTWFELSNGY
jgi:RimJ/RimL family protein N-acetyltransferase